jgi:hypothetical protein
MRLCRESAARLSGMMRDNSEGSDATTQLKTTESSGMLRASYHPVSGTHFP